MSSMPTLTDAELLTAYGAGHDDGAFGELTRRYTPLVYRTCHRLLRDPHEAEDAAQAVFVVLGRKADSLHQGELGPWLYRVAHHVAAETVRKRMRRTRRETAYAEHQALQAGSANATDGADPAVLALIDTALRQLPARYREAVILRYFQNHSEKEAAARVGCPLGTFSSRVSKGIARLRQNLGQLGVTTSTTALIGLLTAEGSAPVPPAILTSILATAKAAAGATTATATTLGAANALTLAKGALKTLFWAKVKTATAAVVLTAGVVGGGGLAAQQVLAHRVVTAPAPAPAPGGQVWAWGDNQYGQLGDGTTSNSPIPVRVPGLDGVIAVAAGSDHTVALLRDHTVWAWGANGGGQLGDGTTTNRNAPVPVKLADASPLADVTVIAAGVSYSAALRRDGSVWTWGLNDRGQLGDGTMGKASQRLNPLPVKLADGAPLDGVTAIAAGQYHLVALKADRTVWAWGYNFYGQLGDGSMENRANPVPVKLADGAPLSGVMAIAGGGNHTVALKSAGSVWTWGHNSSGQLNDGTTEKRLTPVPVTMADGAPLSGMTAIAGGWLHTAALKSDGSVWTWGLNDRGQLGDGTTVACSFPVPVRLLGSPLSGITAIASGLMHTVARQADGSIWVWGRNDLGQLGDGTTTNRSTPVPVKMADRSPLSGIAAIAAGGKHTVVLLTER